VRWHEFEASAPELAALGMAGFREGGLGIVGTLRADGWPRISPNEVYFVDGDLMLQMMRASRKSADLERDPRVTVMTPQADREATRGDFKLYGHAVPVLDPDARRRVAQAIFDTIGWRPLEPFPLYAVDIDSAAYIDFTDERRLLRWSAQRGLERLVHPDDADTERGTWE
jgi:hypothetical protein